MKVCDSHTNFHNAKLTHHRTERWTTLLNTSKWNFTPQMISDSQQLTACTYWASKNFHIATWTCFSAVWSLCNSIAKYSHQKNEDQRSFHIAKEWNLFHEGQLSLHAQASSVPPDTKIDLSVWVLFEPPSILFKYPQVWHVINKFPVSKLLLRDNYFPEQYVCTQVTLTDHHVFVSDFGH